MNQPVQNFLTNYITDQLEKYKEPERKGTPRGEAIGMSKAKFHAALLSLGNRSGKEISDEVGVSYGLLRKWGTEKKFQQVKARLHKQFVKELEETTLDHVRDNLTGYQKYYRSQSADLPYLSFIDSTISVVNPSVLNELIARLIDAAPIMEDLNWAEMAHAKLTWSDYLVHFVYAIIIQEALFRRIRRLKAFQRKGNIYREDVRLYQRLIAVQMHLVEHGFLKTGRSDKDVKLKRIMGDLFSSITQFHDLIRGHIFQTIRDY